MNRRFEIDLPRRNLDSIVMENRTLIAPEDQEILWLTWGQEGIFPFDPLNPTPFGDYP